MKKICITCKTIKEHTYSGYKYGRRKIYLDEHGKRWNGRECGACDRPSKSKDAMQTPRRCNSCNEELTPTRYFTCEKCRPVLDDDDGDWTYL